MILELKGAGENTFVSSGRKLSEVLLENMSVR